MINPIATPVACIIERVARAWGLTPDDLLYTRSVGGNHKYCVPRDVECRQMAMLIAHELLPHVLLSDLGRRFNRDPTTVMSNVASARKHLLTHHLIAARVERLKDELRGQVCCAAASSTPFLVNDDNPIDGDYVEAQKQRAARV